MNKWINSIGLLLLLVLGACSVEDANGLSPEAIVANAVEEGKDLKGFHMKAQFDVYQGEEQIDDSSMEQWMDYENMRTKVIAVDQSGKESKSLNDGETITLYTEGDKEAYEMEAPDLSNPNLMGSNQREQIQNTLNETRKTHTIELIGEEEVNGIETYHIKATPKEKGTIRGEEEYWIEKESWIIVKTITKSDNMKVEYTVTELEIDPSFKENTFTIDLPEGVEVLPFEALDPTETVTLEEAQTGLEQPFLYLPEGEYEIDKVEKFKVESLDRTEVSLQYKQDEVVQFTLSIFPTPEESLSMGFENAEEVTVRGVKGEYTSDVIQNLTWDEEGLRYSLLSHNPELTKEALLEISEKLELKGTN
ncbi:LolA family protein [Pontibacillus salipaludis]|uniref:LolA family protein n=1 Tax=Pontibacillus salipaludis TaxID=1697394 RepID=UPI0031E5E382